MDYVVFSHTNSKVIDIISFNPTSKEISLVASAEKLSIARSELAATTINVGGIDYAVFGGGEINGRGSKVVDIISFNPTSKEISLVAHGEYLSVARGFLAATTINVNGIDYAVFGGGG